MTGSVASPAAIKPQRDLLLLLIATLGTFTNYAPLLSVVPLWSAESGTAKAGIGAATGVTMATTVAIQLCMSRLLRRYRLQTILAAGALLLGAPTFSYLLSSSMGWVLTVSAVRGVGFGMVAVTGSALAAELAPATHRGRAIGWYGVAVGLPQVICLPLGVWIAQHVGFTVVFLATGAASLLAFPLATSISKHDNGHEPERPANDSPTLTSLLGRLASPWTVLITVACALGGITAFLPLTFDNTATAPIALFLMSATVIVGRWTAGTWSDRMAHAGYLLLSSTVACALGMMGFALAATMGSGAAPVAFAAAVAYGLGFGALQNDTLNVMFRRAGPGNSGAASTVWNLAYDAGTGLGALIIGWGTHALGLGGAFAVTAALIALLSPLARTISRREHPRSTDPDEVRSFADTRFQRQF